MSPAGPLKKGPRVINRGPAPQLPDKATAVEVWEIGLRFFKWVLPKSMEADYRLKIFELARKWISTEPVDLPEADKEQLEALLENVRVLPTNVAQS